MHTREYLFRIALNAQYDYAGATQALQQHFPHKAHKMYTRGDCLPLRVLNDEYENENQEKDILQTNGDDIRMNRASKRTWGTQKTVGTALVVAGIICGLLSFVLNRDIFPILGVYLLICGVSCLTIKKHIVLVLSWITILPLYYFSRRIDYAMWVLLLILVVLLALTIRCFVKEKSSRNP